MPEASIGFVHGQMSEIQLENTLMDFIRCLMFSLPQRLLRQVLILQCQYAHWSENADHMGLSTLYQLRGRVGRSNHASQLIHLSHVSSNEFERSL